MGEPPLSGAVQLITTLSGCQVVVGAAGCAGTYAVKMLTRFGHTAVAIGILSL